ncbi:hypothetical protein [uncultured Lacinutrix sp.]|uniref:hypothetical protein n=1 Tax=uncultured Lacinutrix sp. TaxID=574032 RepID=UPI002631B85E|nr:hypothetical protein [uncultured Lacinutrix sp.]
MKAIVISKESKNDSSIKNCLANTKGISNLVVDKINHKFIFEFSTHNVIEGVREKLISLGFDFEFVF